MHQLHDAEVAQRLLYHLARAFGCPDAVYLAGPMRIQGGFDAAIFGFTLDRVPPPLVGPLILRLSHADADPGRVKLETVVQNALAGFPAPRVMVTESDPGILGGPFMVMTRLSGQTLAHGIEGLGAGTSLVGQLQLLFNLPAVLARIIDQWVDMQIRLHQLPAETLLRAVTAAGIDAGAITFEGQLARLSTIVERSDLIGLKPGLTWLDDHRPPQAREAAMAISTRSTSLPTRTSPRVSSTGRTQSLQSPPWMWVQRSPTYPPFRFLCHGHCVLRHTRLSARLYDATSARTGRCGRSMIRPCSIMRSSAPWPSWFGSVRRGLPREWVAVPSIRQPESAT
jgi:hypothetical protein